MNDCEALWAPNQLKWQALNAHDNGSNDDSRFRDLQRLLQSLSGDHGYLSAGDLQKTDVRCQTDALHERLPSL